MCSILGQPEEVTSPGHESHWALSDQHKRQGHRDEARPYQKFQVLRECRLCRQLV